MLRCRRPDRPHWVVAVVLAVTLCVGACTAEPPASKPSDTSATAPNGAGAWRTEYYRGISFQVPAQWGYALDPERAFCALPQPWPAEYDQSYVSFGFADGGSALDCVKMPSGLIGEHITVQAQPSSGTDDRTKKVGAFWVVSRRVGLVDVWVFSKDRDLAEQIADSVRPSRRPSSSCPGTSAVQRQGIARPEEAFDLTALKKPRSILICEYDQTDAGGLRAQRPLAGDDASVLLAQLQAGASGPATSCQRRGALDDDYYSALPLLLLIDDGTRIHELPLQGRSCGDTPGAEVRFSNDGTSLRGVTQTACRSLLVPPIMLQPALTYSGQACA